MGWETNLFAPQKRAMRGTPEDSSKKTWWSPLLQSLTSFTCPLDEEVDELGDGSEDFEISDVDFASYAESCEIFRRI